MMILYIEKHMDGPADSGERRLHSSLQSSTGILKISKCCRCERNQVIELIIHRVLPLLDPSDPSH